MGYMKNEHNNFLETNDQPSEPEPGDWCMDCGLFPDLDGLCSNCGKNTEEFRNVKEGDYCLKCGRKDCHEQH